MPDALRPDRVRRILVRAPNWIGDAVMCAPALQGLRQFFSSSEITLLARSAVEQLLRDHSSVDRTVAYEHQGLHAGFIGKIRMAKTLKSLEFDLAILFPNSFESALVAWMARIPRRYGYATDGRQWFLTDAIFPSLEEKKLHQVRYYEELIRPLCPTYSFQPPELQVSAQDVETADQLLATFAVSAGGVLLGLNPGSMYGGAKRWLPERFAEAADRIVESLSTNRISGAEARCVIVGAPGEERLGHEIAGLMRTDPIVLSGQTSLGVLKAVIQRCRLFLSNDTGPMHIANALGVPVIAVFGPTDHTTTSPFASGYVVVRTPVDCSPCLLRECPIDHRCMTGLTVEQVVQAAEQVLTNPHASTSKIV